MPDPDTLVKRYQEVRDYSLQICEELEIEDYGLQVDFFVSPSKWHLAHTTWFFEEFILKKHLHDYHEFDSNFCFLFNSYYNTVGEFWPQAKRGLLSRPTVSEVKAYREMVDRGIHTLIKEKDGDTSKEISKLIEIGIHHEQQHQELMFMDLKYNFGSNPLRPTLNKVDIGLKEIKTKNQWLMFDTQDVSIGVDYKSNEFCFDNETPSHSVKVNQFQISDQLVTNGEYLEFVASGEYKNHNHWYSDGYSLVKEAKQGIPLYWFEKSGEWFEYKLGGVQKLNPNLPVSHLSFYEASAYACYKGCRLPTEFEFDLAGKKNSNFHNELWQWTISPYSAFPGYRKPEGAIGEYNQKFMLNQLVLKGGCVATPSGHYRPSYRNFFYPDQKWMFSGLRLAKDVK